MAGLPAIFMKPIAICYLHLEGDENNKCELFHDTLVITHSGRAHSYQLLNGLTFNFTYKMWMLPFVAGGIGLSLSLLVIFRDLLNPWLSLLALVISVFALYVGWEGSSILQVGEKNNLHSFPIRKVSPNLRLFTSFVKKYVATTEGDVSSILLYYVMSRKRWAEMKDIGFIRTDEGFFECFTKEEIGKQNPPEEEAIVITIDPLKVKAEIRWEISDEMDDLKPRIIGELALSDVVNSIVIHPGKPLTDQVA